jgi:hypothetical protein
VDELPDFKPKSTKEDQIYADQLAVARQDNGLDLGA